MSNQNQNAQQNQQAGDDDGEKFDPLKDLIYEGADPVKDKNGKTADGPEDGDPEGEEDGGGVVNDDDSEEGEEGADPDGEEGEEGADPDGEEGDKDKKPSKKKKTAEERIAEITRARRQAEREREAKDQENADLRARLAKLEEKMSRDDLTQDDKDDKSELKAPDPKDFEYGEFDPEYRKAEREYDRKIIRQELRQELESDRDEQTATKAQKEFVEKRDAQLAKGLEKYDDFEDVVLKGSLEDIPDPGPEAASLIIDSEYGADILYHMAQNPEEAQEIAERPLVEQARYIGKLEAKFSSESGAAPQKTKRKATQAAPPPTKRAKGANTRNNVPDDTEDFNAFAAKYNISRD